ncbi:hypothetical protein ACWCRD_15485 [Streptomyces sp. NPDC002092]
MFSQQFGRARPRQPVQRRRYVRTADGGRGPQLGLGQWTPGRTRRQRGLGAHLAAVGEADVQRDPAVEEGAGLARQQVGVDAVGVDAADERLRRRTPHGRSSGGHG